MPQVNNVAKTFIVVCIIRLLSSNNCIIEELIHSSVVTATKLRLFQMQKKSRLCNCSPAFSYFFFSFKGSLINFPDADNFGVEKISIWIAYPASITSMRNCDLILIDFYLYCLVRSRK